MLDIKEKSVSLIGYGISNKALCKYLIKQGCKPVIRCADTVDVPKGAFGAFGENYLDTKEDVVFRSPSVRPDKIRGDGQVLTEADLALNLCRGFKIGISGSDGKTTTTTLVHQMLREGGKSAFIGGNIGFPLIKYVPLVKESDYLVAELSSFQLMDMTARLHIGAVTSISENHLDWHAHMDEYICAKSKITKNASLAVLNYDDPIVKNLPAQQVTYFSTQNLSHLVERHNVFHIVGGEICYNEIPLFPVKDICLKGSFNIQNVLCAVACTYGIVGKDACHRVAKRFCGVEGRMEEVGTVKGVKFICSAIDSTPTRTDKTLSAFDKSRVVCILGGYDKNLSYDLLSQTLQDVKGVVLCGENSEKIEKSINRHAVRVNTLEEAVTVAYKISSPGDFVILSPASASFDMFKNYHEKASCFKNAVRGITTRCDK